MRMFQVRCADSRSLRPRTFTPSQIASPPRDSVNNLTAVICCVSRWWVTFGPHAAGDVPVGWFAAPEYWLSRLVFQRALAVIYLVAFAVAANQFRPLLGSHGIQPIPRFVRAVRFS